MAKYAEGSCQDSAKKPSITGESARFVEQREIGSEASGSQHFRNVVGDGALCDCRITAKGPMAFGVGTIGRRQDGIRRRRRAARSLPYDVEADSRSWLP